MTGPPLSELQKMSDEEIVRLFPYSYRRWHRYLGWLIAAVLTTGGFIVGYYVQDGEGRTHSWGFAIGLGAIGLLVGLCYIIYFYVGYEREQRLGPFRLRRHIKSLEWSATVDQTLAKVKKSAKTVVENRRAFQLARDLARSGVVPKESGGTEESQCEICRAWIANERMLSHMIGHRLDK
jgi:hypothetical protein